jgi:hypothetical protein
MCFGHAEGMTQAVDAYRASVADVLGALFEPTSSEPALIVGEKDFGGLSLAVRVELPLPAFHHRRR